MTHWYPYRWVCDSCQSVHYFDATERGCCRCGKHGMTQQINNAKLVAELERRQGEKPAKRKVVPPVTLPVEVVEEEEAVELSAEPSPTVAAADNHENFHVDCDDEYVANMVKELLE